MRFVCKILYAIQNVLGPNVLLEFDDLLILIELHLQLPRDGGHNQ